MPQFSYKARTPEGEPRSGVVEARTVEGAVDTLQRQNLVVTEISPAAAEPLLARPIAFFTRVKQKDLVIFSRQLSTLFQAKVPVAHSLRTLAKETGSQTFRTAITAILDDVSGGSALSQAMGRHPRVFSRFYLSMVRAGEESGKLEDVFLYLADYLDRSYALTSKARNALIYPAFVFAAMIGVMIVMFVVVIPRLTSIFEELGQEVPIYTRIIIGFSSFLVEWGFVILLVLAALAVVGWRFIQTERGAYAWDGLKIRLPILGGLLKKVYLARLSDNLATLIVAGIPIIRALEITAEVVANGVYERIIRAAAEAVKAGNTISTSFDQYAEIPPLVTQMIRVGEESGRLDFLLKSTASFYQRDVDNLFENFVSLIEPALIVFLGLGVAFIVAAVLVPLYNLSTIL